MSTSNARIEVSAHLKTHPGFGTIYEELKQSASNGYGTAVDERFAFSI